MTSMPGIFAAGECEYSQHGGNRLGANSLLSAIYDGMVAGPKAIEYIEGLDKHVEDLPSKLFEDRVKEEEEKFEELMKMDGGENAYQLHKELGEWMTDKVKVVRYYDKLLETDKKMQELLKRWEYISINDTSRWSNQAVMFTRQLKNMMHLARVITMGAYHRDDSR